MANINIDLDSCIIPMYKPVLRDVLNHGHTHYVFPGGRGSTKSSFAGGISVPMLIMQNPMIHAICFRKVANTIQNSIFAQVVWGIYQLGVERLFKIPKTYSTPIVYIPTGQRIFFMGLDDPMKVKSIKPPFGYIGITWFEELDQYAGPEELRNVTQSTMRGGSKFWDFRTFNPPISKNNWANEYTEECEIYRQHDTLVTRNSYLDVLLFLSTLKLVAKVLLFLLKTAQMPHYLTLIVCRRVVFAMSMWPSCFELLIELLIEWGCRAGIWGTYSYSFGNGRSYTVCSYGSGDAF